MDTTVKKRIIIAGIILAVIGMIIAIVISVANTKEDFTFTETELRSPKGAPEAPTTIVYEGFSNLRRLNFTASQVAYLEANITEYIKASESITSGVVTLTSPVIEPAYGQDGTNRVTIAIVTPAERTLLVPILFRGNGDLEFTITDTAGTPVYIPPQESAHTDELD